MDETLADQLEYYRAQAVSYDSTYERTGDYDRGVSANESWKAELQQIQDRLDAAPLTGEVLELGCGTGQWTRALARHATRVTALDGAQEMAALAVDKLQNLQNVDVETVEIIDRWSPLPNAYDGFAAFFFIEHVPDDHLDHLLDRVARSLRPHAQIFMPEGAVQQPGAPTVETRVLGNRSYQVVERRRTPQVLSDAFVRAGMAIKATTTQRRFITATGSKLGD